MTDDPYAQYNPRPATPDEADPYAKFSPRPAAPGEGPSEEEMAKHAQAEADYNQRQQAITEQGNPFDSKTATGQKLKHTYGDRDYFLDVPKDTADVFLDGWSSVKKAFTPQAGSALGMSEEEIAKQNFGIKALDTGQRIQHGVVDLWGGMGSMIASPAFGLFRSLVSRPGEEISGFPKEGSEELANILLMVAPIIKTARSPKIKTNPNEPPSGPASPNSGDNIRITPQEDGTIKAQNIGPDPVRSDFVKAANDNAMDAQRLQKEYFEKGLHPEEIVEASKTDSFLKHEMEQPIDPVAAAREPTVQQLEFEWRNSDIENKPISAGAGATDPKTLPPYVSPTVQPLHPPGRLLSDIRAGISSAFDLGKSLQMMSDPMSTGIGIAQATVKDTANLIRRHDHEWARIDQYTKDNFSYDSRKAMYLAADAENSLRTDAIEARASKVEALEKQIAEAKEAEFNEPTKEGKAAYQAKRAQLVADKEHLIGNAASARAINLQNERAQDLVKARRHEQVAREEESKGKKDPNYDPEKISEARKIARQARERVKEHTKELEAIERNEYGAAEAAKVEGIGLKTLSPVERAWVEAEHARSKAALLHAYDANMVGSGEGLPFYSPRMMINIANATSERALPLNALGRGFNKSTPQLRQRKYKTIEELEQQFDTRKLTPDEVSDLSTLRETKFDEPMAEVAKDIRSLSLATAKLEKAVAVRSLINKIEELSAATGGQQVVHGNLPEGATKYFTMEHPAFKTWKPMIDRDMQGVPKIDNETGGVRMIKDSEGNIKYEQVPIHVPETWKGPLLALLDQKPDVVTGAMMTLKAKAMSLIMLSPMIHNGVVAFRALEAFPAKVGSGRIWFEGNRAKNNPGIMREAIDNGFVPVGKKFFNQDIQSIMTDKEVIQGNSWMAKAIALVPELLKEGTGAKVEQGLGKFGDFWHNTLLWDRVADLQTGLYVNFQREMMQKGIDRQTASRVAAHLSNRFAGSIPREAMSKYARATLDWALFSRQYNSSMVGTLMDTAKGLPGDVMAQIVRDRGELAPEAAGYAKQQAKRKAFLAVTLSIGFLYISTDLAQNMVNVLYNDETIDEQLHGYVRRFKQYLNRAVEHPFDLIQKIDFMGQVGPSAEFEPGKERGYIKAGKNEDGSARYYRNPAGKFTNDIIDIVASPLDLIRRKGSPIVRSAQDLLSNDLGFGHKIYDKNEGVSLKSAAAVAKHLFGAELPSGQLEAAGRLIQGKGDTELDTLRALGPFAAIQVSKGYPGGPEKGIMKAAKDTHDFNVQQALPDIRDKIIKGDYEGADKMMDDLKMTPSEKKTTRMNALRPERVGPRARKGFERWGSDDSKQKLHPEDE